MHIYSKSVHTNACNKQPDVCYLSYFHVYTAINILRCFGYPREHNFGLVLILSPTGCTEGCVYFPQSCRNTPPPFSRLSTQYHIDPLLACLLSLDTSRTSLRLQQSTKFGNRHTANGRYEYSYHLANSRENWAPKKNIAARARARATSFWARAIIISSQG